MPCDVEHSLLSVMLSQRNGVEKNLGYGTLSAYEADKLAKEVLPELAASITKGEKFGK